MTDETATRRRTWWRNGRLIATGALLLTTAAGGVAAFVFRPLPISAPDPLATHNASAERGKYLATIGNCAACHTVPGGRPFAGGVKFDTPFGLLYSTNITPDAKHGIGDWSFEQFHASMKNGVRPDGTHLYPVFPYGNFAKLSDNDVASLYLHFRQVEPVSAAVPKNNLKFPSNNRDLLHFWKRLFHTPSELKPELAKSAAWNRGAYLVEGVAHCGACHSPRNRIGAIDDDLAMTGGIYTDQVASGAYREWSAVDLTPGAQGLKNWTATDTARYLTEGKNDRAVVHGPMIEVYQSTRHLTKSDALAIATYLKNIKSSPERLDLSLIRSRRDEGEVVYTVHCGTCHLPNGEGDKVLGVPLRSNPIVQAKDPSSLINVILYGPDLPPPPFVSNRTKMRPFGKRLSDEDIAAVATYLRSSFGNKAGAVSPDQVREQR